jgi:hypothetical protein
MAAPLVICALLVAVGHLSGCAGYSFSSAHPQDVQSVSVHIFENRTFTTGIEVELADALIKELQRSTPYVVVSSGDANTRLTGAITDARLRQLTVARQTGMVEEMAVDLIVSFDWVDARTGEPLVRRANFRAVETFVPARPSAERVELGRHAAVQEMARSIVAELRSRW